MMDYEKTKNSRMKINALIVKNRFIDIDWLISVDSLISTLICLTMIQRTRPPWEDLVNKVMNFAVFVRFRLHTYARTQQSLLSISHRFFIQT